AGKSIATDLPTPNAMNRAVASPAATCTTGIFPRTSADIAGSIGVAPADIRSALSVAVRISVLFAIAPLSPNQSARRGRVAHTEPDNVDVAARFRFFCCLLVASTIGDAAQRQRQRAELLRQRERFRLTGHKLECCSLADDDLLAVFLFDS